LIVKNRHIEIKIKIHTTREQTMVNNSLFNKSKLVLTTDLLTMAGAANAGYSFDITDSSYITADVITISGDVSAPVVNNLGV
jgi:multidrug resistance efflux pump